MAKRLNNQSDQAGYQEGKKTGFHKGYQQGIKDGLKVIQSILEHNGMVLKDSEFYLEMDTLIQEGELTNTDDFI